MQRELTTELLKGILVNESLDGFSLEALGDLIRNHDGISKFAPDGFYQVDPRNGERIVYNSSRARRPHDHTHKQDGGCDAAQAAPCVICEGKTTGVIDVSALSRGFTFINENLFPMVHPRVLGNEEPSPCGQDECRSNKGLSNKGMEAIGMHFLQWTSSVHDHDWHNMPLSDLEISFRRLAALEQKLLSGGFSGIPTNEEWGDSPNNRGYVSTIKNFGRAVGGSLAHGHQQICFSNVMPRRFLENMNFEKRHHEKFSEYLNRVTGSELEVCDFGEARLVVPYFMRRPYDMFLLVKDAGKRYLHQLTDREVAAVVKGWKTATRAMLTVLHGLGRDPAYNVVVHNGPGAGLYFEFLPFTQETGGYELVGLSVCQASPKEAATYLREIVTADEVL